jgi:ligand-binding sensor domain-containing protein/signal transduction histidine kinase
MKHAAARDATGRAPFAGARAVFIGALGFVLLATSAKALDPSRTIHQYRSTNWSRQNGLPVSGVNALTQTTDGYLWLGTQQGLVRFDGKAFTSFPVARTPMFVSQNISSLAAARRGGLWFGLRGGAAGYFDGKNFTPVDAPWEEPNMQVFTVAESSDGSFWAAWNFGYGRRRSDGKPAAPDDQSVGVQCFRTVTEDASHRVWVSSADPGGLFYWSNGQRHALADESLRRLDIFTVAEDRQGTIWIGTQLGLRAYDSQLRPTEISGYDSYAQVNTLLVDHAGVLWIGTEGDGLIRYSKGQFTRFNTGDGLINDAVTALCEDTEGNVWIGTRGGLTELSDVKFVLYGPREGLPAEPLGVASAGDTVWIATAKGISRLANNTITTLDVELQNTYLKRLWQAANGDLYVIDGARGLSVIRGGKTHQRFQLTDWPVAIAEDSHGLLVSFGAEIYRCDENGPQPLTYKNGQPPPMVWAMNICPAHDGSLWVATHRGVWHIDHGEYEQWSTHNGLPGSVANWIFEDTDGTIWAGLATGIARFKDHTLRCLTRNEGLFDNFIYAIVPDQFGWFWVDSSAGIFRVTRQNLNDVADGKISRLTCESFDGADAVKSNDKHSQEPTAAVTSDGRIWFTTAGGIVAVDPAHIPTNTVPPPVYIQQALVNGRDATLGNDLRAGRGEVEIRYTAVNLTAPEKLRFRYRLEGYDDHWVEANDRRSAFYTNLDPGNYRFTVQACNADGVWNTTGASIRLILPPHFYETGWFITAIIVGIAAVLGGAYAWRVNALRRREQSLKEMNELLDAKVKQRTTELESANHQLADANLRLGDTNRQLSEEIAERKRYEQEAQQTNRQLVLASREAGMAEVATSVLHNVGNVLNSVNVSVSVIGSHLRDAKFEALAKIGQLLSENAMVVADEKCRKVPAYLQRASEHFAEQHQAMAKELESLRKNVEHIKDIVQMQQSYSRLRATCEPVNAHDLIEDALRLSGTGLTHRNITVLRQIDRSLTLMIDKPKVLQVIVNLLRNAVHACRDTASHEGTIAISVRERDNQVDFEIGDTGVGIAAENLGRLFTQGFTTKRDGHGYGLHSSALAARSMGGSLSARSDGPGKGATFTLCVPLQPPEAPDGSASPFTDTTVVATGRTVVAR